MKMKKKTKKKVKKIKRMKTTIEIKTQFEDNF
jgi:hypothetical protein